METKEWTFLLKEQFPDLEQENSEFEKNGHHLQLTVSTAQIVAVAEKLNAMEFFLECLSGVDLKDQLQATYHFNRFNQTYRILIRVKVPYDQPNIPTLSHLFSSANWFEREACEMVGIHFHGHPNLTRLILPEQSLYHPLRKDFKDEMGDVKEVEEMIAVEEIVEKLVSPTVSMGQTRDYFINMGPQHPSTHGVLRLQLHMEGERILSIDPVLGYAHRADEKMAELGGYPQFWPNLGRIDYLCAMLYNWGWARIVEKGMGIEVAPRTEYIRVLTSELNRIASHLLWLAAFLLDLGAFTPFLYCFQDREEILDILEAVTGERITFAYFNFGGVLHDLPDDFIPRTEKFIKMMREHLNDYNKLITGNIIFLKRTKGIGIISKEVARQYGATGPVARGSGISYDIRRNEPYSVYPELDFDIPVGTVGDCFDRHQVRMEEMEQSLRIVEQACKKIPSGSIESPNAPKRVKLDKGEYYQAIESGRGEFGIYLVSDGTSNPYRVKLRTPCFSNLSLLSEVAKGLMMPDLVAIMGTLDLVIPDIDR